MATYWDRTQTNRVVRWFCNKQLQTMVPRKGQYTNTGATQQAVLEIKHVTTQYIVCEIPRCCISHLEAVVDSVFDIRLPRSVTKVLGHFAAIAEIKPMDMVDPWMVERVDVETRNNIAREKMWQSIRSEEQFNEMQNSLEEFMEKGNATKYHQKLIWRDSGKGEECVAKSWYEVYDGEQTKEKDSENRKKRV